MDLQSFVEETLQQIVHGVQAAQSAVSGSGAEVNPQKISYNMGTSQLISHMETRCLVQQVEFDVAITLAEETTKEGGAGIRVAPFNLGGKLQKDTSNTSVSRIRFCVPLALPPGGEPAE